MTESVKVYNGIVSPIYTWGGEGKTDEALIDSAYSEWVRIQAVDWIRVSDVQSRSGSQSLTFDTDTIDYGLDDYDFTIPSGMRSGKTEISVYTYWDLNAGVKWSYKLFIEADSNNYGRITITPRNYLGNSFSMAAFLYQEGNTAGTTFYNTSSYTSHWVGVKMVWDTTDGSYGSLKVYSDVNDTGTWTLVYTLMFNNGTPEPTTITLRSNNQEGTVGWDHVFMDDFVFKNTTIYDSPDYLPTKIEFYQEESNVGGGYMIIPEKNVDYSNYNTIQEDEFIITDSTGIVLFTGMFDEPKKAKDGVRLEFKEITQQMGDRICKRDYNLDTGTVAEVA